MTDVAWDGRSRGWLWLIRLGSAVMGVLGFRGVALCSIPISWLAMIVDQRSRSACTDYWRRLRPGLDRSAAAWLVARQQGGFARVLCDRGLAYLRQRAFTFQERGGEHLRQSLDAGRGCILLSAHLGNWELAGRLLSRVDRAVPVNLVKVENEDPTERALVDAVLGDRAPRIIDPRDPVAASLAIREALSRGEVVGFLGDRVHGQQPAATVPLLGAPVRMPTGPFQVAQLTGAPVLAIFLMRRGPGRYRLEVDPPVYLPAPANRADRRELVAQAVAAWARRLERQMRRYPFQWHNFYHYWKPDRR